MLPDLRVPPVLRETQGDGIKASLRAIDAVEALSPRFVLAGHKDRSLDDDAVRTIDWSRPPRAG